MDHRSHPEVVLRAYDSGDAAATLAVFLAAVTETASADYSPEQIRAWAAPERRDLASWDAAMRRRGGVVAVDTGTAGGGSVVGFSDVGFSEVGTEGHIDMLFVAPTHLRQGIAARLLAHVESVARAAGASALTADVNVTARPFFERHGFTVVAEQRPVRSGVTLINHRMRRELR